MLFTFPSRYWFAIGLSGVFSLAGWAPLFQSGFLVSRPTQDTVHYNQSFAYGVVTLFDLPFQTIPLLFLFASDSPSTPGVPKHARFGLLRFRSPLPTQSLLFSFPAGTEMFQFPAFAFLNGMIPLQGIGLPHSDIRGSFGYLHLTPAFRSLSRPSSPPRAQASTVCPSLLVFYFTPPTPLKGELAQCFCLFHYG